ncbi:hypothetical protein LEMLEM_LOCUS25587, partial [Lemmus lemmus]
PVLGTHPIKVTKQSCDFPAIYCHGIPGVIFFLSLQFGRVQPKMWQTNHRGPLKGTVSSTASLEARQKIPQEPESPRGWE